MEERREKGSPAGIADDVAIALIVPVVTEVTKTTTSSASRNPRTCVVGTGVDCAVGTGVAGCEL